MTRPESPSAHAAPDLGPRPLLVHAHPDDETLLTGVLIPHLLAGGAAVRVLTCTRGERGEIVPGTAPAGTTPEELVVMRTRERAAALAELSAGIDGADLDAAFLGAPPARAAGLAARAYRDSGMRWVRPGLAGPDDGDDPRTFAAGDPADEAADVVAAARAWDVTAIVSYDAHGTYGHPDHVRAHHVVRRAAALADLPFVEIASDLDRAEEEGFVVLDLAEHLPRVFDALRHFRTQLTVRDDHVEHVGGQRMELEGRLGLRRAHG